MVEDLGERGTLGSVGEYGWGGAYHSTYWVDPAEKLVVVYMTQLLPAGGHLASTLGTHYDDAYKFDANSIDTISARPDFMVLVYPVITMKSPYTHEGSRKNLLGEHPEEGLIDHYSNELQVTEDTPPTFIVHSTDDKVVPVMNSLLFYQALEMAGVYSELHIYPEGGHGYALAIGKGHEQTWIHRLSEWLDNLNFEGAKRE